MAGILEGIRVIDMGHVVAVPIAATTLAEWGAEVIKIEPLDGELARGIGVRYRIVDDEVVPIDDSEVSWNFQYLNRKKKGLALNLKTDPGRDVLFKLIESTDIFITNYEASTLKTLKADYESLVRFKPDLIYGLLTGFGTEGPDRNERGFDYSAGWARSGMMHMIGEPGSVPPPQRGGMMDTVTGSHIVSGCLAALLHREKTGQGQNLEFALYHAAVWTLSHDIQSALAGVPNQKHDRTKAANPLFNSYRTKDDRWFWLAMLYPDDSWPDFCRAIERPDLENDPRFNNLPGRWENSEELITIIDGILASRTREEWEKIFRENNCIYGNVASLEEVVTDPQAIANNFFTDLNHPEVDWKVATPPVKFCQEPAYASSPAPEVGQHTEEILLELGYSWEEIERLKDEGAILP